MIIGVLSLNQMDASTLDSLNSIIDEADLEKLEAVDILKDGGDSSSVKDGGSGGLLDEELLHSSQDSLLLNEDSVSSMDIDLNVLDKVSVCVVELSSIPHIDEPARNPCQILISWTSQDIDSYVNWFG